MKLFLAGSALLSLFLVWREPDTFERRERLSEYGFFKEPLAKLIPAEGVIRYELNTPLFSNYAEKSRFIKLPEGGFIQYDDSAALGFPVGTILIKNFYYPRDFRKPEKGRQVIETRLLVHESTGWQAYPYLWDDDQTDAYYDPAGEVRTVSYTNASGKKIKTSYVVPNKNQCKGCHARSGQDIVPIGPTARQLNRLTFDGTENQLERWQALGVLAELPAADAVPRTPVWDDESSGTLNARARAYLDINCGHCHSRSGAANTSGLFLDVYASDPAHLGVFKAPVAAGRGAGDLQFDIEPGKPHRSILVYRMKTNDPAIAMPEIGREQIHEEGVALIEEWIRKANFQE